VTLDFEDGSIVKVGANEGVGDRVGEKLGSYSGTEMRSDMSLAPCDALIKQWRCKQER